MSSQYLNTLIGKANGDLIAASVLMQTIPPLYENAGFHIQQAIEKFLKAYLLSRQVEVPLSHNLIYLLNLCIKIDDSFTRFVDPMLTHINDFAVTYRYDELPGLELISLDQALLFTNRIKDHVISLIG